MQKKLIFLDIDGTLIPPGGMVVPTSAVEAIHRAQANGHKVFLCTGRNVMMTAPLFQYGFDGAVCSAGGHVLCDDKVLFDCPMEPEQLRRIREFFRAEGISCILEARNATFGDEDMIRRFSNFSKKKELPADGDSSELARWVKAVEDSFFVRPVSEYQGEPVYKVCYMAQTERQLAAARAALEQEFFFCGQNMPDNNGLVNGELINRRFTKGTGIQCICDALGASLADTIGFGDSLNDLGMCEVVGISYCMANGAEELKKLCDRVCPAVQDDGIAKAFAELELI